MINLKKVIMFDWKKRKNMLYSRMIKYINKNKEIKYKLGNSPLTAGITSVIGFK